MLNQDTTIQHLKDTVFNVVIDIDTVIVKDTVIHTVNDTVLNTISTIDTVKSRIIQPYEGVQFTSNQTDQTIPALLILGLFILGGLIWLVFKILADYITPFLKAKYNIKRANLFIYRVKIITWILYIIFSFYQIISSQIYIGLLFTAFIILIGYNFWKDLITGILLKFSGNLNINDKITLKHISGKIQRFNVRNLQIETENDEVMFIPYRSFLEQEVSKKLNKGEMRSKKINLEVSIHHPLNSIKAIEKLLMLCPWVYSHKPTKVYQLTPTTYEVTIHAADDFTFNKIETYLKNKLT
jgi:hypothetical protein